MDVIKPIKLWVLAICVLAVFFPNGSVRAGVLGPTKIQNGATYSIVSGEFVSAIVIDVESGMILYAHEDEKPWPAASLTKIMSGYVFLENQPAWSQIIALHDSDDVGGGKLSVPDGALLSEEDLFYSSLTASANNAATAMPRIAGMSNDAFLERMNATAKQFAMRQSHFVSPSGIEPENMTSARDIAKLAFRTFGKDWIRKVTTTGRYAFTIRNTGEVKNLKNTNRLLTEPQYGDLYVTGGKTGFLYESMYNLVVQLRPTEDADARRTLIVVVLGAPVRDESFETAKNLARWTWDHYAW
jgi:D-alanyl-D-alanine endopeptidase (penicillin-binding protein 7)